MTKEEYIEYLERRKEDFKRMYPCILSIKEKIDIVESILDTAKNHQKRNRKSLYLS